MALLVPPAVWGVCFGIGLVSDAIGFYVTGKWKSDVGNNLGDFLAFAALFLYFYIGGWKCGEWWFSFKLLAYSGLTAGAMASIGVFVDSLNCKDEQTAWVVRLVLCVPAYLLCAQLGAWLVW